jgi:hypothetical protein
MKNFKNLLFITISLLSLSAYAQTSKKTLNYQAVILDPKAIDIPGASISGQPLNKGNVCLRFSLLNAQGGLDYEETQQVTTDEFGLVSVAIGAGSQAQASNSTSVYKSFESIVWNASVKSLKVSVSYDACSSFKQVSTQSFNYTPYALYAESVEYKNVREAPTKLSQFNNDAGYLVPKDLDPLKTDIQSNSSKIATANQNIADNKQASDAAFLVVNQSLTSLDKQVAENTSSITTMSTKLTDQQNQITATNNTMNAQIGGLQGQINNTNNTVSNLTGVAELQSNKSTAIDLGGTNPSDQAYPSQKAAKAYVDQIISQIATTGVPDATTLAAGKLQLAGDLGGTATNPTVPALANKENTANKSLNVLADGTDNTKYPSVKAVKDYVDAATYGTALAADLANKANIASPAFTGVPTAPTPASSDNSTKLATTAFVQAATAGIALQASVDAKADKNSPIFTGTPTAPTPASSDNSTKLATTAYVDAQVAAGAPEASSSSKGIIQLAGALGGTASSPTVPGLTLKEDLTNKSTAADLGASSTSDEKYPSQKAVKTYVDNQVATATIADASSLNKGKLQLAGDLAGTAAEPLIATGAITSAKILDQTIATADIADLAITDGKIGGIAGTKVTGNIAGNAANVTGTVTVSNGGTGATDLTGYVKGNGTNAMSTVSSIPVADVSGAVRKVNGSLPNSSGEVSILFGRVTSGNYANVPTSGGINGDIYIVSGDGNASNNGRTFIKDDANWNEVSTNTAATDARYLQLSGGIMDGTLSFPAGKKLTLTDAPTGSTDAANKDYVDAKSAAAAPDASSSVSGKIKLAGDLSGTYDSPSVPGLATKAPISNPSFTGTVSGITKSMVGLGNVENTSDANKPVSTAAQSALDLKAPIASPSFTGTVSGITATMVGLGNVTNKSEADLAISTATATALSAKENSVNKSTATDLGATNASHDKYPSQLAVKTYVDASLSSGAPDADGSTKGKVQLAGDLTGTAASPSIATGAITSTKIADETIANTDISPSAAIVDTKLATIATAGKVSNSATTATNSNSASAIVARDINGDFSAGTITATLSGNAATATKLAATKTINGTDFDGSANITVTADATTLTGTSLKSTVTGSSLTSVGTLTDLTVTNAIAGSVTGTAANVTGTVAVANGGTGTSTASPNVVFAGPTSGSTTAAPSFRALVAADLPTLNQNTSGTAANVTGTVAIANGGTGSTTAAGALSELGAQSVANLSTDMVADGTSTSKYPAVKTIKDYVTSSVSSGAPDADGTTKGKIQLAGDLTGTAASPSIATGAITSTKIADETIANTDISPSAAIVDTKLATIATAGKVNNSATTATDANTASAIVARDANGNFSAGTITANLTGNVTGNAATATKLAATKTINGTAFDGSSNITVTAAAGTLTGTSLNSTVTGSSLTSVGTLTDLTVTNAIAGSVTGTAANVTGTVAVANGGTGSTTAAGALSELGAQSVANLSTDMVADGTSTSKYPAVKTIKDYVTSSVSSGAPDADGTTKGKIQLAGDLTGTAASPSIATGAITSTKIADETIANTDISPSAAIVDTKLATIATAGKVNNSATTATDANTASAIVARDANGNFSAGTITANLTGNVTGNAATATKLAATKTINGTAFDGSSNITVTAAAGTLTGTSLNSTVTGSSLTSVGTLTDLTVTNAIAGSVTGTAANVTGTVAIANGGTGSTTESGALANLGAAPAAGSSSIATVGTVGTGTWQGSAIAGEYGGTGVNNSGKTITLGGNINTAGAFSTSGAFATTLTTTAVTAVTLPTYGTLATLSGPETLSNKALTLISSVGFKGLTSGTATLAAPSVAGTTTISLPGASGTLATLDGTETLTNKNSVGFKGATSGTATLAAPAVAGTTTITLPGATGTLATLDGTETLTNKNSVGFKGATSGTATLAAPAVAGTTTITLPGATGTLATLAGIETLTNKNSVGFKGATSGTATLVAPAVAGTTTITLPSASGTLITSTSGLPLSGITGSFTTGNAVYASSATALTTGTLPIGSGGTGLTATPTNGQIDIGNGTGFTRTTLTAGTAITITNAAGSITISAAVRPTSDQFTASAGQASFTLTQTPLSNPNSKPYVWMFINGVRANNNAYSVSGSTVSYTAANNNNYTLVLNDRIQFDYSY